MKIKYRHASKPDEVRICDSVKDRKANQLFAKVFGTVYGLTQQQHDDLLLKKFEADKCKGVILSFGVVTGEEKTK